jgi:hypothetical protein
VCLVRSRFGLIEGLDETLLLFLKLGGERSPSVTSQFVPMIRWTDPVASRTNRRQSLNVVRLSVRPTRAFTTVDRRPRAGRCYPWRLRIPKAIDANGERRGRASEAASRAAKSVELASLQTTRSFTYLTLNSSLFAIGIWSQLATAFSIRILEREVEIGKRLADILDISDNRPTKHSPQKAERAIAGPTIDETTHDLAMAADAAIQEAARKAATGADQLAARIDDAAKGVVAAGNDAAQTIAAVADDSEREIVTDDGDPELVTATEGDQEIELRAERLVINKRRRQNGEARVRKQIVTEVKSIDVPVSHEELVIERYAVTGDAVVDGDHHFGFGLNSARPMTNAAILKTRCVGASASGEMRSVLGLGAGARVSATIFAHDASS